MKSGVIKIERRVEITLSEGAYELTADVVTKLPDKKRADRFAAGSKWVLKAFGPKTEPVTWMLLHAETLGALIPHGDPRFADVAAHLSPCAPTLDTVLADLNANNAEAMRLILHQLVSDGLVSLLQIRRAKAKAMVEPAPVQPMVEAIPPVEEEAKPEPVEQSFSKPSKKPKKSKEVKKDVEQ